MIKKTLVCALAALMLTGILASCKQKTPSNSSSSLTSSNAVSSQMTSSEDKEEEPKPDITATKNSFMAVDQNGDFFYCGSQGGIYKLLSDERGISRIFSSVGYNFFSVSVLDEERICVGYKTNS